MKVALTFDAELPGRPHHDPTAPTRILDALAEYGVRATFFIQGRWANAEPGVARRIAADGHLIGNHGHHHVPLTLLTDQGIEEDVEESASAIFRATRRETCPLFRCPFGKVDQRVLARLDDLGPWRHVGWDLHAADWEPSNSSVDVASAIDRGLQQRGQEPTVVLLHTWPRTTADMLPGLLLWLHKIDTEFVTVVELDYVPVGTP